MEHAKIGVLSEDLAPETLPKTGFEAVRQSPTPGRIGILYPKMPVQGRQFPFPASNIEAEFVFADQRWVSARTLNLAWPVTSE